MKATNTSKTPPFVNISSQTKARVGLSVNIWGIHWVYIPVQSKPIYFFGIYIYIHIPPSIPVLSHSFTPPFLVKNNLHIKNSFWLVVSTPLKNISQLGWLFPMYGKKCSKPPTKLVMAYKDSLLRMASKSPGRFQCWSQWNQWKETLAPAVLDPIRGRLGGNDTGLGRTNHVAVQRCVNSLQSHGFWGVFNMNGVKDYMDLNGFKSNMRHGVQSFCNFHIRIVLNMLEMNENDGVRAPPKPLFFVRRMIVIWIT